ncbi:MAG: type IV pilus twitching motility protein PilT [Halanaerobiaceae bacterium]
MLNNILQLTEHNSEISDIHLSVNSKPIYRYLGILEVFENYGKILTARDTQNIAREIMNEEQWEKFQELGEIDLQYSPRNLPRFRINIFLQRGDICLAMRKIPGKIPTIASLGLPEVLGKLALKENGLVLCTGPTGSGKSTTLAAMIDIINSNRQAHVITLEDPIEYLHTNKKCIIHQRQVNLDTKNFVNGLRAALRQDPDVILVGEMRDLETISIALQAAETGHLVLATLHTTDAPKTVDRIIDAFPGKSQKQVRVQLAGTIQGIIAQTLLPRADSKGRAAAMEILIGTPAAKNIIREGQSIQLETIIQTNSEKGMISLDNHLLALYKEGTIAREIALRRAKYQNRLKKRLNQVNGGDDINGFNL